MGWRRGGEGWVWYGGAGVEEGVDVDDKMSSGTHLFHDSSVWVFAMLARRFWLVW